MAIEAIELKDWISKAENQPKDEMYWKEAFWRQVLFVRDILPGPVFDNYEHVKACPIQVVGTHRSKSIELPVYHIDPRKGIRFWMRENFYDWNVSVDSERPVPDIFHGLFPKDRQDYCFFQGFDDAWKFETYEKNQKQFSFYLDNEYQLWSFFFLIREGMKLATK